MALDAVFAHYRRFYRAPSPWITRHNGIIRTDVSSSQHRYTIVRGTVVEQRVILRIKPHHVMEQHVEENA